MKYAYEVSGTAEGGQTWFVEGELEAARRGEFPDLPGEAMREAFHKLTQGKAVYGEPGKGCDGPYLITRLLIEQRETRQ